MLYNLMLEVTGRLQKCCLYEMSNNKVFRSTVSYLIVRDMAHEKVFAKALEVLGVTWGKVLPVPKIDTSGMPEVRELESREICTTSNGHLLKIIQIWPRYSLADLHLAIANWKQLKAFQTALQYRSCQKGLRNLLGG
jgi:Mn-containing catalase